ncbi:MAG: hypothetical protein HBSAPP02_05750 [Phycisphaerae bacterium]|nr:MAG: hypothetical protein HRU71_10615 [Planctomycetia bacterium]GJQ25543.1 MAG: hypothetical protein HBSAPP02_05750 [Phycisphaerae bacterium]
MGFARSNARADDPSRPRTEIIYYDSVDEHGNLAGGMLELPFEKPDWAIKPASPELRDGADNRIDLVIVGDGYTAAQQSTFHAHAAFAMSTMFTQQPFATYAPLFLIHEIEVISIESGVDNDPTQGILKNTALDMAFWCNGIERLLCVNVNKAYNAASAAPDVDLVLALANSTKYGGAGYTTSDLATSSGGNGAAPEIAIHEFGHSLGNLADEYTYGGPVNYTGPEPSAVNVSTLNAAAMAAAGTKWAAWLGTNNPAYDGLCSTFEGGMYSETGIYRPSNNSKMRALGRPFNHPSAEALIIEIYKLVRPIDDATPTGGTLNGSETVFVDPVDPIGNPLAITWKLDGDVLPGATGETLDLTTVPLPAGAHALQVIVQDTTTLVRNETARQTWMTESRTWNLFVPLRPGDVNCDGIADLDDVSALALALLDAAEYAAQYPDCPATQADVNGDSLRDGGDVAAFLSVIMP